MKSYVLILAVVVSSALGQQTSDTKTPETKTKITLANAPQGYVLGPGDQFSIEVADLEELNGKVHRIDEDGTVTLPLIGRLQAAGYTLPEFEKVLDSKLVSELKDPRISITVTENASEPVTVVGEVNSPGMHQMRGQQSLVEAISAAGGLKPDAGYRITVTRQMSEGDLPLPNVRRDDVNRVVVGEINANDILEARNESANIRVMPHDVITVPRAKVVYVIGEVHKAGGFTLEQHNSMSIVEAVALAQGTTSNAAKNRALVLRREPGDANRSQIKVNLDQIMTGKTPDMDLRADDILLVPNSLAKQIRTRMIETAVATGSGVLIWHGL
jgi:polysaccharide export outer membrane protein